MLSDGFRCHRAPVWRVLALLLALSLSLLAACGPGPTPTPVPTATATPRPTATPTPTPPPLADWVAEGDALLRQSDFEGAEAVYRRVLEVDDEYGPAYVGLSSLYSFLAGQEEEALAQAETAVELAPDSALAHAALARAQTRLRRIAEAVAAAEAAADLDSESPAVQAALAEAYALDAQYAAAQTAAEAAVEQGPGLADAYAALADSHAATADFARARAALEKAIELEPEFAYWHVLLGVQWRLAGDSEAAEAELQAALDLAPDYGWAVLGMAYAALTRRDHSAAATYAARVAELLPDAPHGRVAEGYVHLEQGDPQAALVAFRQALLAREDDWNALLGIGHAYVQSGDCASAQRQGEELLALFPDASQGQVLLGLARLCEGQALRARQPLREAVRLAPYDAYAHLVLGLAYREAARWDEAQATLAEALRLSPWGADVHTEMGHLYAAQGETDRAEVEYEIALRLDPGLVSAQVSLGQMLLAEEAAAEAQARAEEALALQEDDPDALLLLGQALLAQGRADDAAEALSRVVDQQPENATGYLYLGLAHRDAGRYEDAIEALQTVLGLDAPEVSQDRIAGLIMDLEDGYVLDQEEAFATLGDTLGMLLEEEPEIRLEDLEGEGRTLVIAFEAPAGQEDQEEMLLSMGVAFGSAAAFLPRLEPPAENGLLVQVEQGGQYTYTLAVSLDAVKGFAAGLLSPDELTSEMRFSRTSAGDDAAPLEQIQADTAQLRGLEPTAEVPFRTLTEGGLEEWLSGSIDAEMRQSILADQAFLVLFGILELEDDLEALMTDLYTEQVAGFYDPDEKAFYLVESQEQTALDQMTIAHEYVHALQDQHFGLEGLDEEEASDDSDLAFDALVEGDATLAMFLYGNEYVPVFSLLQAISSVGGVESEVLDASPLFIQEMEMFPYESGLEFVMELHDRGGWEAVDAAYADPPVSTEQILHPERYADRELPLEVALPDLVAALSDDWQELDVDVMGELVLRLALAEYLGPGAASVAAEGWGGDQYVLLTAGAEGPHVLAVGLAFDDEAEAKEFWSLWRVYLNHRPGYSEEIDALVGRLDHLWWRSESGSAYAERAAERVTIVLGADEDAVAQVVDALGGH